MDNAPKHGISSSRKRLLNRCMLVVWIGVFLFSGGRLLQIAMDDYMNRELMKEAAALYHGEQEPIMTTAASEEREGSGWTAAGSAEAGKVRPQFDPLLAVNEDVVGWVTIDGTPVDYPIVQAQDNAYYLNRNYKQETTRAGSIFMDYRNRVGGQDRNTIIYGHRMKDGSMFGSLKHYLDESYFKEHGKLYYDDLYAGYDIEIFAVYTTTSDVNYIRTDFATDEEYGVFLSQMQARSIYNTGVEVTPKDRIITLSTCDYILDPDYGRLVVQGKLVPRTSKAGV